MGSGLKSPAPSWKPKRSVDLTLSQRPISGPIRACPKVGCRDSLCVFDLDCMDELLRTETVNLTKSWMQHDREMLRDYLVTGVEDPRINVQSILSRHFLNVALFGKRFEGLFE